MTCKVPLGPQGRLSGIISKQLFEVRHKNERVLIFRCQVLVVSISDFGDRAT